jgi:hypothetical protein
VDKDYQVEHREPQQPPMRFTTMMLCEHATLSDNGLVGVLNGGVNRIGRPTFPAPLGLSLVGIIDLPNDYLTGTQLKVQFTVTSPDEQETFARVEGFIAANVLPGADPRTVTATVVLDLSGVLLTKMGVYKVNGIIGKDAGAQAIYFEVVSSLT